MPLKAPPDLAVRNGADRLQRIGDVTSFLESSRREISRDASFGRVGNVPGSGEIASGEQRMGSRSWRSESSRAWPLRQFPWDAPVRPGLTAKIGKIDILAPMRLPVVAHVSALLAPRPPKLQASHAARIELVRRRIRPIQLAASAGTASKWIGSPGRRRPILLQFILRSPPPRKVRIRLRAHRFES